MKRLLILGLIMICGCKKQAWKEIQNLPPNFYETHTLTSGGGSGGSPGVSFSTYTGNDGRFVVEIIHDDGFTVKEVRFYKEEAK